MLRTVIILSLSLLFHSIGFEPADAQSRPSRTDKNQSSVRSSQRTQSSTRQATTRQATPRQTSTRQATPSRSSVSKPTRSQPAASTPRVRTQTRQTQVKPSTTRPSRSVSTPRSTPKVTKPSTPTRSSTNRSSKPTFQKTSSSRTYKQPAKQSSSRSNIRKTYSSRSRNTSASPRSSNRSKVRTSGTKKSTISTGSRVRGTTTGLNEVIPTTLISERPAFEYKPSTPDTSPVGKSRKGRTQMKPGIAPEQIPPEDPDPDPDPQDPDPPDPGHQDPPYIDPPGDDPDCGCDDDDHTIIIYNYGCHHPWWHYWCYGFGCPVYWGCWDFHDSYWCDLQWVRKCKVYWTASSAYCDFSSYTPSIYMPAALATGGPNPEAIEHLDRGAEYFRAGRYIEAMHRFRMATLADLDFGVSKFAYAHALFALGNYEYAAFEIRKGLEVLPDWIVMGGDLKQMYDNPEDFEDQLSALKCCLDLWNGDENVMLVLGYVSFFSGDLYGAEQAFLQLSRTAFVENANAADLFLQTIDEIKQQMNANQQALGQLDD